MPLDKIKTYMQTPSPSQAVWLLENQEHILSQKIEHLRRIQDMLISKKNKKAIFRKISLRNQFKYCEPTAEAKTRLAR